MTNEPPFIRRVHYWDKQGRAITRDEWTELFEHPTYRTIKQTKIGKTFISTVWLGINHNTGRGRPLIFETMVFDATTDPFKDLYCDRYATLDRAEAGHDRVVSAYLSSDAD